MRAAALLLLGGFLLTLGGCASQQPADPNKVSSIPWARPERWENGSPLGSMLPGSNGGY
jgi:hypothetical protein